MCYNPSGGVSSALECAMKVYCVGCGTFLSGKAARFLVERHKHALKWRRRQVGDRTNIFQGSPSFYAPLCDGFGHFPLHLPSYVSSRHHRPPHPIPRVYRPTTGILMSMVLYSNCFINSASFVRLLKLLRMWRNKLYEE